MRDLETISMALAAAEKGTIVFGTLHTNNAAKTIDRIISVFPADEQEGVRNVLGDALAVGRSPSSSSPRSAAAAWRRWRSSSAPPPSAT